MKDELILILATLVTVILVYYLVTNISYLPKFGNLNQTDVYLLEYFVTNKSGSTLLLPANLIKLANFINVNNDTFIFNKTIYNQIINQTNTSYKGFILINPTFNYSTIKEFEVRTIINQSAISEILPYLQNCEGFTTTNQTLLICQYKLANLPLGFQSIIINKSNQTKIIFVKNTVIYDESQNKLLNYSNNLVGKYIFNGTLLYYNNIAYLIPSDLLNKLYFKLLFSNNYLVSYGLSKIVYVG
ncbi:MAG: hypothetical protein OH318_02575 [Candidatus Parvarchaeota archaeon]|nr:hypothetical protein [Candidatus Rehaiarchaeum fermentans]MCW1293511.1 hypothetical protein [Candidatus Rehaiarchaeum fermentans]